MRQGQFQRLPSKRRLKTELLSQGAAIDFH
jgi:hypothetical protein